MKEKNELDNTKDEFEPKTLEELEEDYKEVAPKTVDLTKDVMGGEKFDEEIDEIEEEDFEYKEELSQNYQTLEDLKPARDFFEEDRKEHGKTIIKIVSIIGACLLIGAAAFFGFKIFTDMQIKYAAEINGTKISAGEYRFFLLLVEGDSETAVEQMKITQIYSELTKKYNVTPDEEINAQLDSVVQNVKESFTEEELAKTNLTDEKLREIFATYYTMEDVYNKIVEEYVPDWSNFESDLDDFINNSPLEYTEVLLRYIFTENLESAEKLKSSLTDEQSFEKAALESMGEAPMEDYLEDLHSYLGEEYSYYLLSLEPGTFADCFDMGEGAVVFYVESKNVPTHDEIAEIYRTSYTESGQSEYYMNIVEQMMNNADIKLNQKAIDTINADMGVN